MKYSSAASFAAALNVFVRRESEQSGQSIQRIRHEIAFDRILARLLAVNSDAWLLKGGVALEYRLPPSVSRTTVDVDVTVDVRIIEEAKIADFVSAAVEMDMGDYFTMKITAKPHGNLLDELKVHRYKIRLNLSGKMFDTVAVDIGITDHVFGKPEILESRSHLSFAGIEPLKISAIPLEQHLAEKLHAYTRIYEHGRESSRVKDLVDIVILAQYRSVFADRLSAAIQATFRQRSSQDVPTALLPPPIFWEKIYRELAADLPIPQAIEDAFTIARIFFEPILAMHGSIEKVVWIPSKMNWREILAEASQSSSENKVGLA